MKEKEFVEFIAKKSTAETRQQIKQITKELESDLENLKSSLTNSDKFIERAKKYTDLSKLTPEILRDFIYKVFIYDKAVNHSRVSNQRIENYYRDIGYLVDYTKETDIAEPPYDFVLNKAGELICVNEELSQIVA